MICRFCHQEKTKDECYPQDIPKKRAKLKGTCKCKSCAIFQSRRYHDIHLHHVRKYGLTADDYRQRLKEQDFRCWICGREHKERPDKKWGRARLAIDHDHTTGKVRGLLCYPCNKLLGIVKDSARVLRNAASYLDRAA